VRLLGSAGDGTAQLVDLEHFGAVMPKACMVLSGISPFRIRRTCGEIVAVELHLNRPGNTMVCTYVRMLVGEQRACTATIQMK
jgi:hypothetical protein